MKETWLLQLDNIKRIIDGSLLSLQNLVKQSDDLQKVIELVNGDGGEAGAKQKESLEGIKKAIDKDIATLIVKIKDLFDTYNALLSSIFD